MASASIDAGEEPRKTRYTTVCVLCRRYKKPCVHTEGVVSCDRCIELGIRCEFVAVKKRGRPLLPLSELKHPRSVRRSIHQLKHARKQASRSPLHTDIACSPIPSDDDDMASFFGDTDSDVSVQHRSRSRKDRATPELRDETTLGGDDGATNATCLSVPIVASIPTAGDKPFIIGLVGFSGAGKRSVANVLVRKHGFVLLATDDAVKNAVAALYDWDRTMLDGATDEARAWCQRIDPELSQAFGFDVSPRIAFQWAARPAVRALQLRRSVEKLAAAGHGRIVVTDIHSPEQIAAVIALGGCIFCIHRDAALPRGADGVLCVTRNNDGASAMPTLINHYVMTPAGRAATANGTFDGREHAWLRAILSPALLHTIDNNGSLNLLAAVTSANVARAEFERATRASRRVYDAALEAANAEIAASGSSIAPGNTGSLLVVHHPSTS